MIVWDVFFYVIPNQVLVYTLNVAEWISIKLFCAEWQAIPFCPVYLEFSILQSQLLPKFKTIKRILDVSFFWDFFPPSVSVNFYLSF